MNSAGASGSWSRQHWYGVIILIFIGQLIFIFWLGQRTPFSRRWVAPGPAIRLAGPGSAELLSLTDPTLFALPHVHGFWPSLVERCTALISALPLDRAPALAQLARRAARRRFPTVHRH